MTRENAHTSARLGESQHATLYPTKTSALQDSVCGKRRTPLFRVNATALTFIAKCLLLVHTLPYLPIFIINMKTESENVNVSVTHSCPTLCNAMECRILQARILEWVAVFFPRRSSNPGIKPGSPELQADSLPPEQPGKIQENKLYFKKDDVIL